MRPPMASNSSLSKMIAHPMPMKANARPISANVSSMMTEASSADLVRFQNLKMPIFGVSVRFMRSLASLTLWCSP